MLPPLSSSIRSWKLANKNIILRADLNINIGRKIIDTSKFIALKPTLDYLSNHAQNVTIITHIGRPKTIDPSISTKHLIPLFAQQGYNVVYAQTIEHALQLQKKAKLVVLENIRFWIEEQQPSLVFAQQLAQLGDFYCNDAFGTIHRNDTSLTLLAEQFNPQNKSTGFLIERETKNLFDIFNNPKKPFLLFLGGKKIATKIPYIMALLEKVDTIALMPAIVFTFLHAQGIFVGKSIIDECIIDNCKNILFNLKKNGTRIILPKDIMITQNKTFEPPYTIVSTNDIPNNAYGVTIGPQTLLGYQSLIANAQTILFNGPSGFIEKKETIQPMINLLSAIGNSSTQRIAIGGDTLTLLNQAQLTHKFDNVSTGGGAALAYICNQSLPALTALLNNE